ncbi:hypothetical protein P171DRAFT_483188 [Karstenula rhodostoma CBS 690.94]|uniref:Ecp2 effector protein domain-containing protein n=1 Tax=Karstenula rhodostoma CBS 690.94 TaxID=1392251 RepID=A0A9P4PNA1_9PLEO|nr:hypothetical protein P171DRAFT_483188 [Karstenula rhodostoma CBS 690.94]
MIPNILLLVLLPTSCSALPSTQTPPPHPSSLILFGSALSSFTLPSPDPWTGTSLVGPSLAQSPNRDWPDASCGPDDAYGPLDGIRQCAVMFVKEIPTKQCISSDRLDGPGMLHCVVVSGEEIMAAVKSWSRTNESQIATCGEVGQAVIWVLDNCSRNDRQDTAGWKSVPGKENHLVGVTNWR